MPGYIVKDEKTKNPVLLDLRELDIKYRIPVSRIEKFYQALDQGIIMGTKCPVCGARFFPPQAWCSDCGYSGEMEFYPLDTHGHLMTFTKIFAKPKSFSSFGDYTVGIAHLDKEDLNILAWIDESIQKPEVGMETVIKVEKRKEDGATVYFIASP
ncbi:Zn-ribbon domain-containing OB-fold protein [Thermoplasma sp.]|uniref:Zn-ribbon domain-containing OB-fold protein n=1 Tax=Thermoplasma sp. TaxID=1973142 RepID=UPI001277CCA1|nr:Zn-ribbon domain-containing OB-fold protein [Thermoplasma sp.]KAA8922391.1 MAG: Zn-ribbon domain-containing OB-fold protein [Thermoplasma sp.]